MCTAGNGMPGSVAEALQTIGSCLDYLNGPAGEQVEAPAAGGVLRSLAAADAKHSAAWMRFLSRFDAGNGHDADGCANSAAWLAGQCRLTPRAAKGSVKLMRLIGAHPLIAAALAEGEISGSWAAAIAAWSDRLPTEMRPGADEILLGAAAAGADLDDLKLLANAAWEEWKSQRPDPGDDDGYDDRCLNGLPVQARSPHFFSRVEHVEDRPADLADLQVPQPGWPASASTSGSPPPGPLRACAPPPPPPGRR